ncbi:MAG: hypothetical protein KatS3mg029_0030 [Saprospiraceae bacterium]|nr:MAG: hypothetical protein KatS3mg029_0030 [Saprospiraceae bacterium]
MIFLPSDRTVPPVAFSNSNQAGYFLTNFFSYLNPFLMAFNTIHRRQVTRVCCLIVTAWICSFTALLAHSVQVGYCILNNGYVRVWVEHWHGGEGHPLSAFTMEISQTVNGVTTTSVISADGAVDNTPWNQLPGCGASINIISACPDHANQYNDWVYFDFAPSSCNVPISVTFNNGTTFHLEEGCSVTIPRYNQHYI